MPSNGVDCFLGLLGTCSYLPPYSDACLNTIWTAIGCEIDGNLHPRKVNSTYQAISTYSDLVVVMEAARINNLDCYGFSKLFIINRFNQLNFFSSLIKNI